MNREQIIQMAKECGLLDINYEIGEWDIHEVTSFASLIASAEREACAKVADTISDKYGWGHYGNEVDTADEIAAAIRARGQA